MKRATKDSLWAGAIAVVVTGLITWHAKSSGEKKRESHERGVYR